MADTLTTNYGWVMPEDQASADTWGQKINSDLQAIDGVVYANLQAFVGQIKPGSINWSNPNAAAGQQVRWTMNLINTEATGNVGSDLNLFRCDNTGTPLNVSGGGTGINPGTSVLTFTRSTGAVTFNTPATFIQPLTYAATLKITNSGQLVMAGSGIVFGGANYPTGGQNGSITNSGTYLSIIGGQGAGPNLTNLQLGQTGSHNGAILTSQQGLFLTTPSSSGQDPTISFCDSFPTVIATMSVKLLSPGQIFNITSGGASLELDNNSNFNFRGTNAYKAGGGSWSSLSDERIKTVEGEYADGLEQVLGLNPVVYRYKGNDGAGLPTDDLHVGLIAQEVEQVMPAMVSLGEGIIDGEKVSDLRMLDTSELIFTLVNSIKELHARIQVLEGRN